MATTKSPLAQSPPAGESLAKRAPASRPPVSTLSSRLFGPLLRLTGFSEYSYLVYFLLTAGMFALFSAFQFAYFNRGEWMKPISDLRGELYWFKDGLLKVAMQVHLWSVVPAGILLPLQFIPRMRRRYLYLHKVGGRALLILLLIGQVSALSMISRSFGGAFSTQTCIVAMGCMGFFAAYKAWSSILNLRIDQHRVWMIRTWAYAGAILSLRIFVTIFFLSIKLIAPHGYKVVTTCKEIDYIYQVNADPSALASLYTRYPACANLTSAANDIFVVVSAGFNKQFPEEYHAIFRTVFGSSAWAGLVVNILLSEMYLNATAEDNEKLKKVSMIRRKAAGLVKEEKSA